MCVVSKMLGKLHDGFEMPTIFREKMKEIILTMFTIEIKSK